MSHNNPTSEGTTAEALEIIREEQVSPTPSSERTFSPKPAADELKKDSSKCICKKHDEGFTTYYMTPTQVEELLKEKETELRAHYDRILEREKAFIKERFDYVLLNEQIRSTCMLREAHRERQEKITALQSQLQCKNLAALMYVMCTERRRSRLEKLRIIRDYTTYIGVLQDILTDAQNLILHLSRGYKTTARVDHEWREKMKKVVKEFMSFIYHFAGGSPETNQYLIDLPKLLKTEAPIVDNPNEDPCEKEEEEVEEDDEEGDMYNSVEDIPHEKTWYEQLDSEHRPFVMFGDMCDFKPSQRREVFKHIKAKKTAPKKWKEYANRKSSAVILESQGQSHLESPVPADYHHDAFRDMFLKSRCGNLEKIKDAYLERLPLPIKFECNLGSPKDNGITSIQTTSKTSFFAGCRGMSIDPRGNMGSILKITSAVPAKSTPVTAKTALLGARDSMEIQPSAKLRENARLSLRTEQALLQKDAVVLDIGNKRRTSVFDVEDDDDDVEEEYLEKPREPTPYKKISNEIEEDIYANGSSYNDSRHVIPTHVPDTDHKINYERVCPMEKCQRMQVDSFMRSLPPYMRANPFTHFEQTFNEYETCTPEQLEILKQRIEKKKMKESILADVNLDTPLSDWVGRGVAVQTSDMWLNLPPCTCHESSSTSVSSNFIFNLNDLIPIKQAMDAIKGACLYDDRINFDRFKLIGQDSMSHLKEEEKNKDFKQVRYKEIKKILRQHPSLLEIFQANVQ